MDQRALYERQVAWSEASPDEPPALVRRDHFVIEDIRKSFGDNQSVAIAELSIGSGRTTAAILSALPNARLTCAEISERRISDVRASIVVNPAFASRLPSFVCCNFDTEFDLLASGTFDAVIALDILEHVLDVFGFMDHCHRILRAEGRLYLRVPNIAYLRHRFRLLFGRIPITASWFDTPGELFSWREKYGWDGGHLHLFTLPMLRKLFDLYGFHIDDCSDPGAKIGSLRRLWPSLLFANPLIIARK